MSKKLTIKILIVLILTIIIGGVALFFWQQQKEDAENVGVQIQEPKTYSEVFSSPIDPNTEPEEHKAIYDKISGMVGFKIQYSERLPLDAKLTEVKSTSKSTPDSVSGFVDVGGFTSTYKTKEGKSLKLIEGTGDLGGLGEGEKINFTNGKIGYFWLYPTQEGAMSLLWFGGDADTPFRLTSQQLTKEELIEFANSILTRKQ